MTRFGGRKQVRRASEATMRASRYVQFVAACVFASALGMTIERTGGAAAELEPQVDKIFSKWTSSTPGCAVGVAVDGKPALAKAYGMADLEHDVKNTADTIFEAGSVSKQFTAAAVLLLAREGKLSLDDPVRRYIPELPDYPPPPDGILAGSGGQAPPPARGTLAGSSGSGSATRSVPLTIRHLLHHTSGLRDWGNIAGIAGWPRTTRVHTHAHVLEIVSRQRSLNFTPGTRWSYSNTGFNLAAIIVSRVSGKTFADFTRTRIFEPLGMSHTSWRDDHTRIVRNRAIAYDDRRDGFHIDMPFENVHGNGGLLTTVGDLLKWNENFTTPTVGDAAFVAEQQHVGAFSDGRSLDYAFGLYNRPYKGVRQVDHSGSTAGYRAHLARYPDQRLSAAVLCNVSSGGATEALHAVADLYLGDRVRAPAVPAATYTPTPADFDRTAGLYRNGGTGVPLTIAREGGGLRVERGQSDGLNPQRGQALIATAALRFMTASGQHWEFDGRGGVRAVDALGTVEMYERVTPARPTIDQLRELAGTYVSDEAETALTVAQSGESLVIKRRPDTMMKLTPVYADAFAVPQLGLVIFHRDGGRVAGLSVSQDRVWDLRFARQSQTRSPSE
jgi:CubicO group peptidase (beta-lactamase class C family)